MPSVQIITQTVTPGKYGSFDVSVHIANINNINIKKDLKEAKYDAREEAQSSLRPGGYTLPPQTVLIAEEPFPCYDKL